MRAFAVALLSLSACGSPSAPSPSQQLEVHDTDATVVQASTVSWDHSPTAVIFDVTTCCGYRPQIYAVSERATLRLFGDGRMIGESESGRMQTKTLSEDEMTALLTSIEARGFFGWSDTIDPYLADAGLDEIHLHTSNGDKRVKAYGDTTQAFTDLYTAARGFFGYAGTDYVPQAGSLFVDEQAWGASVGAWPASLGVSLAANAAAGSATPISGDALAYVWNELAAGRIVQEENGVKYSIGLTVDELRVR